MVGHCHRLGTPDICNVELCCCGGALLRSTSCGLTPQNPGFDGGGRSSCLLRGFDVLSLPPSTHVLLGRLEFVGVGSVRTTCLLHHKKCMSQPCAKLIFRDHPLLTDLSLRRIEEKHWLSWNISQWSIYSCWIVNQHILPETSHW